jgi:PKHD-type hydroxylase
MHTWHLSSHLITPWATLSDIFSKQELENIILLGTSQETSTGLSISKTGLATVSGITKDRKSENSYIYSNQQSNDWLFKKLTDAINYINSNFWNYYLTKIECLQFTQYSSNGDYYNKHCDIHYYEVTDICRKLSFSIQLSDPSTYTGGDLLLHFGPNPIVAPRDHGTITFFPSTMLHEVLPVTSGIRYSLVGWVQGPKFK